MNNIRVLDYLVKRKWIIILPLIGCFLYYVLMFFLIPKINLYTTPFTLIMALDIYHWFPLIFIYIIWLYISKQRNTIIDDCIFIFLYSLFIVIFLIKAISIGHILFLGITSIVPVFTIRLIKRLFKL